MESSIRLNKIDERKKNLIETALKLFSQNGIEGTSIQDIANEANIGVASIYRYYTNKQTIVIEVAMVIWDQLNRGIGGISIKSSIGIDMIEEVIDNFIYYFKNNPSFLRFVENFDIYISNLDKLPPKMDEYQDIINRNNPHLMKIIEIGLKDRSIRSDLKMDETFTTIMHTIFCLAQKLFLRGNIIPQDSEISPETELNILKDIIINYIKQ